MIEARKTDYAVNGKLTVLVKVFEQLRRPEITGVCR
jgi:hypothetical protein